MCITYGARNGLRNDRTSCLHSCLHSCSHPCLHHHRAHTWDIRGLVAPQRDQQCRKKWRYCARLSVPVLRPPLVGNHAQCWQRSALSTNQPTSSTRSFKSVSSGAARACVHYVRALSTLRLHCAHSCRPRSHAPCLWPAACDAPAHSCCIQLLAARPALLLACHSPTPSSWPRTDGCLGAREDKWRMGEAHWHE